MAEDLPVPGDTLLLMSLMDNVTDSVYFKDLQFRMLRVSRKMANDLGFADPAELIGKSDFDLFGEEFGQKTMIDDLYVVTTGLPIIGLIESRSLPDGTLNWTSTSKMPLHDSQGKIIGVVGITREVNDLKKAEMDLQYLATHDVLTQLPNRYLLHDRLEHTLALALREKTQFAVLYIDLDGFKEVNDIHGHAAGDALLKLVAARILSGLRKSDTVARMGGDEFVVVLEHIHTAQDALATGQKLQAELAKPHRLARQMVSVTASIGISLFPAHGRSAATLLKAADHAMYLAKQLKNTCTLFNPPQRP